ncbi:MAG: hypothetical protein QOE55_8096 [Acidobacteriaceae bacterium]|jgi:hypothetical protein|nr:hypothetical protein [Acidobacteriaceae bacterium]
MAAKTVHVYPSEGTWEVKREGKSGKVYTTQREAVEAARKTVKNSQAGQFVVHSKDGHITERGSYKMTRSKTHRKRAVGPTRLLER